MAIFKCKMCGGTLEVQPGESVAVCDSCGTKQTLPKLDDERRANLYDRANHFRRNGEFDKAEGIFESILAEDNTDAEAYWSLILCKYGINYVEDPRTHKRIPTINRAQFTPVQSDDNYKSAIKYADGYQRDIYEAEAKQIDAIQKGILVISKSEKPFDVFISYKELDSNGERTKDSVYAQDIYNALTKEGYKVFFSRITLEGKLGTEYEPYIFAALNSAKVMLTVGTSRENFESPWVKNEWSRFLSLIKTTGNKVLIPVYKDMDAYDLPDEMSMLAAQDMGKIGFMQDLVHGIEKIAQPQKTEKTQKNDLAGNSSTLDVDPLLERAFMFLEDGNWQKTDDFCEEVLNRNPKNARAYLGKLMAELHVSKPEQLQNCRESFENNVNYSKIIRFGDDAIKKQIQEYSETINERIQAEEFRKKAEKEESRKSAKRKALKIVIPVITACIVLLLAVKIIFPTVKYNKAVSLYNSENYEEAKAAFEALNGFKDSDNRIEDIRILARHNPKGFSVLSVGDSLYFGTYEQDNDNTNGAEDIEWLVLEKHDNRMLLLSKYALEAKPYSKDRMATWEKCTLRSWLNNDFYNSAFSDAEKMLLLKTKVTADNNPEYNTNPGKDTEDNVFMLSIREVNRYFTSDEERQCIATAYATENGATVSDTCYVWWWLRSPGSTQDSAARVYHDGSVRYVGDSVSNDSGCVRPALWINLDYKLF